MKTLTALLSILIVTATLLTSCQNTSQGLNQDIDKNVKDLRKAINSN